MLLSIIIPIYNVENYIKRCLLSVLNQATIDYEVILIDDCSPDASMAIVQTILKESKHSNRVKIVTHTNNQGLSSARNSGLRVAIGKYVWFVDSDDYLPSNALALLFDILNSSIDIFRFRFYQFKEYEEDNVIIEDKLQFNISNLSFDEYLKTFTSIVPVQLYVFNRQFLLNHDLYFIPGILHEDKEFILRVFAYADELYVSEHIIYYYLIRNGSITKSVNLKRFSDLLYVYNSNVSSFYMYTGRVRCFLPKHINSSLGLALGYYKTLSREQKKTCNIEMVRLMKNGLFFNLRHPNKYNIRILLRILYFFIMNK